MAIERRLTEIVGPVGGRLHTARSRNDQVATDVAMFVRAHAHEAIERIRRLAATLIDQAERHLDWPLPGYTHLQRAQPIYLSHHLLAYVWMLIRDRERFAAVGRRLRAAAAGRRRAGRRQLRHRPPRGGRTRWASAAWPRTPSTPSPTATSCSTIWRRPPPAPPICPGSGAEIVLWSSEEFGFCEVSDAWASGSSIMPQKKNPDAAELLRAKAPRLAANLGALYGVMHGLPLTYNKDMQEDKERLFDSCDTLELCLEAADGMLVDDPLPARAARRRRRLTSSWRRPTSPICSCGAGCRFARPTAWSPAWSGSPCSRARRCPSSPARSWRRSRTLLDDEFYALLRDGAWLESKVSEGGTSLGRCASSWSGRAPRCGEPERSTTGRCSRSLATWSAAC